MTIAELFGNIQKKPLHSLIVVLALSTVSLAVTTSVYRSKYVQLAAASGADLNQVGGAAKTSEQLIKDVARLIDLPTGEKPTIATVADPEKLKSQPFFAQTKIGDKVLIYPQAHEAILYRPSEHKLIEVGPFTANVTSTKS